MSLKFFDPHFMTVELALYALKALLDAVKAAFDAVHLRSEVLYVVVDTLDGSGNHV